MNKNRIGITLSFFTFICATGSMPTTTLIAKLCATRDRHPGYTTYVATIDTPSATAEVGFLGVAETRIKPAAAMDQDFFNRLVSILENTVGTHNILHALYEELRKEEVTKSCLTISAHQLQILADILTNASGSSEQKVLRALLKRINDARAYWHVPNVITIVYKNPIVWMYTHIVGKDNVLHKGTSFEQIVESLTPIKNELTKEALLVAALLATGCERCTGGRDELPDIEHFKDHSLGVVTFHNIMGWLNPAETDIFTDLYDKLQTAFPKAK